MSERKKIIAETIKSAEYPYRIWDNGDIEEYYGNEWTICNSAENTDIWKENIRKLIPGKKYRFVSWGKNMFFEDCFSEHIKTASVILQVYGFDPVKCPECGSQNTKNLRCLDCGEWL